MVEFIVLIILILFLLGLIYYKKVPLEGFTDIEEPFTEAIEYHLKSCPSGYKSFYDADGTVMCCDGDIIAKKCMSDKQCILTGSSTSTTKNCVSLVLSDYSKKGEEYCPPSMKAYFENRTSNVRGCTDGFLNDTLDGPKLEQQKKCVIYPSLEENIHKNDSCYHYKKMDEFECFGKACIKEVVAPQPDAPPLISVNFTDGDGIRRTAYTRESMENYLNTTNPHWREQGVDLSKNTSVAEVAREIYVNKTRQEN